MLQKLLKGVFSGNKLYSDFVLRRYGVFADLFVALPVNYSYRLARSKSAHSCMEKVTCVILSLRADNFIAPVPWLRRTGLWHIQSDNFTGSLERLFFYVLLFKPGVTGRKCQPVKANYSRVPFSLWTPAVLLSLVGGAFGSNERKQSSMCGWKWWSETDSSREALSSMKMERR